MNINQLLIITFLLFIYIKRDTYEHYSGTVSESSCVERILNYECLDEEKRQKLNSDCQQYELYLPTGLVQLSCDDKLLFDTLMCNKMFSEGACDCSYGRKQVNAICNVDPLNMACPPELQSKDLAIIEKIEELQVETQKCENVIQKEKELFSIASSLKNIMKGQGLIKEDNSFNYIFIGVIVLVIIGLIFFFMNKKT